MPLIFNTQANEEHIHRTLILSHQSSFNIKVRVSLQRTLPKRSEHQSANTVQRTVSLSIHHTLPKSYQSAPNINIWIH